MFIMLRLFLEPPGRDRRQVTKATSRSPHPRPLPRQYPLPPLFRTPLEAGPAAPRRPGPSLYNSPPFGPRPRGARTPPQAPPRCRRSRRRGRAKPRAAAARPWPPRTTLALRPQTPRTLQPVAPRFSRLQSPRRTSGPLPPGGRAGAPGCGGGSLAGCWRTRGCPRSPPARRPPGCARCGSPSPAPAPSPAGTPPLRPLQPRPETPDAVAQPLQLLLLLLLLPVSQPGMPTSKQKPPQRRCSLVAKLHQPFPVRARSSAQTKGLSKPLSFAPCFLPRGRR
mmetsp:Transcript_51909/g.89130  ORF Transcript_51909/g.89130 Transcript_51909/m.89130 type:complete len:280 (-) Transcript_51909:644-1483(-)